MEQTQRCASPLRDLPPVPEGCLVVHVLVALTALILWSESSLLGAPEGQECQQKDLCQHQDHL